MVSLSWAGMEKFLTETSSWLNKYTPGEEQSEHDTIKYYDVTID
jgi:hypothetical protein